MKTQTPRIVVFYIFDIKKLSLEAMVEADIFAYLWSKNNGSWTDHILSFDHIAKVFLTYNQHTYVLHYIKLHPYIYELKNKLTFDLFVVHYQSIIVFCKVLDVR